MTNKYKNVYIEDTYTICGNYENDGPLSKYFDKKYEKDLYFGEMSWEKAEVHLLKEANEKIKFGIAPFGIWNNNDGRNFLHGDGRDYLCGELRTGGPMTNSN